MSKKVKCDRTDKLIQLEDGFFTADPFTGTWQFVSANAPESGADYNIPVSDLIKSAESLVDWLAHIHQKTWFKPDLFFDFFVRFRRENGLFGG
jgi:hypothetical protein